ncbi:MAG: hypothetical protein H0U74_04110 [Bradymonadaceae bacterium]|nr:hypothetical protein [Lujinxingiaceae bacterium]
MIARNKSYFLSWVMSAIIALLAFATGCDLFLDVDEVRLSWHFTNPDTGGDAASDTADLDTTNDIGDALELTDTRPSDVDASDVDIEDEPVAPLCPTDFGKLAAGICDPVNQNGCQFGRFCQLVLFPPLKPHCILEDGTTIGSSQVYENCSSERCAKGLFCVNWRNHTPPEVNDVTCARHCFLETGAGCTDDEFCTQRFSDVEAVGFCVPRCDPYSDHVAQCGQGAACVPDASFLSAPSQTCHPNFRCLRNAAPAASVNYKSSCNLVNLHLSSSGCPLERVCYPIGGNQNCVKPCKTNADCTDVAGHGTCRQEQGLFALSYCDT